jgi:iron complex outermembrane receptor protein
MGATLQHACGATAVAGAHSFVRPRLALKLLFAASAALLPAHAHAQNRTSDNAVTQAEDAFGYSVGRESLGIYNADNARGFSPSAAGNIRLNGLYFSPVTGLSGLLVASQSIKVGLSAQGYPFVAPSGIVDQSLRLPSEEAGASVLLNFDSRGTVGAELDASLPLAPALALGIGLNAGHTAYGDGTNNHFHAEALIARWRPAKGIEITPFWSLFNAYDDESSPFYIPAGGFLPPLPPARHFVGPWWDNNRYTTGNHGMLASAELSRSWLLRVGAFRSVSGQQSGYAYLMTDLDAAGRGRGLIFADPPHQSHSLSGEVRLTHVITEGPRLHTFHLSVSGRDTRHQFGGSDSVDLGPVDLAVDVRVKQPVFNFGPQSRDRVRQATYGAAYDGRWRNVGELSFGVSRTAYRKSTALAGAPILLSRSDPWLYNGTVAVFPTRAVAVYAGYARGLEESGTPPPNAANRNQALPAILTRQMDGGVRVALTPKLRAVAGLFDLRRPYFGFDPANRYVQVGSIRSRGAEVSLAGNLSRRLDVVAGGVFLDPRVEPQANATGVIGRRPVGIPSRILNLSANWSGALLEPLSLDASLSHFGPTPGTTDDVVTVPPRTTVNLGARYRFSFGKAKATARLQLANLFDQRGLVSAGPGAYFASGGRMLTGYVAVDL